MRCLNMCSLRHLNVLGLQRPATFITAQGTQYLHTATPGVWLVNILIIGNGSTLWSNCSRRAHYEADSPDDNRKLPNGSDDMEVGVVGEIQQNDILS